MLHIMLVFKYSVHFLQKLIWRTPTICISLRPPAKDKPAPHGSTRLALAYPLLDASQRQNPVHTEPQGLPWHRRARRAKNACMPSATPFKTQISTVRSRIRDALTGLTC